MQLTLNTQQEIEKIIKQGFILLQKKELSQAVSLYQKALGQYPKQAVLWHNLSLIYKKIGIIENFVECTKRAYALQSQALPIQVHLAQSLFYEENVEKSDALFSKLLEENPQSWEVRLAYAETLIAKKNLAEAKQVLLSCEENVHILDLLGSIDLHMGNYREGFQKLQQSYQIGHRTSIPIWQKEDIFGKRVFIDTENDIQSLLLLFRFLFARSAKHTIFYLKEDSFKEVDKLIKRNLPSYVKVYKENDSIDYICSLVHLPLLAEALIENEEKNTPYLKPDFEKIDYWKNFLQKDKNYRVALTEYTDSYIPNGQLPSISEVTFYKTYKQTNFCLSQNYFDVSNRINSLDELAAFLVHMDLIVTSSEIIAHLAGALNKKAFVLHQSYKPSRWFTQTNDSFWYPCLRFFHFHQNSNTKDIVEIAGNAISFESEITILAREAGKFYKAENLSKGMELFEKIVEKKPSDINAWLELGWGAYKQKKHTLAMSYLQKAYEQNKEHPHILIDLACALCNLGQHEKAETILRRVIAKYPNKFSSAYGSLGIALSAQKKMEESLKNLEQALLISPNDTRHQQNLSCCYLLNAELEKGWKAGLTCFINKFKEKCIIPFWTGQDLKGKTLLVANEQGIGDTLQYLRYIPLLQQKGVRIILDLRPFPFLKTLFTRSLSKETILYENGMKADYVSSITLLGLICETTSLSSIPATVPYLTPSPYKMSDWKHFFAKDPLYKVGLVWKGNPNQSNDSTRSTTLERLAPLSEATNCSFYGIQKDHSEKPPANMRFTDLSSKLKTFDDTAAILMHLDLLITVDTSVAHLGGALARPMWVILGHPPAQQWLLEREDSPWYPTAKLFRSKSHNGWDPVIQNVKNDLILLSKKNELL